MRSPITYRLIWALIACFACLRPSVAQDSVGSGLDPNLAISQYILDHWEVADGLPQNTVAAIAQTPDGFLWLATQEGLVRFDGVEFTVFDPDTEPALKVADIITLWVGNDSTLWVATRGGGLLSYRDGRFVPHGENNEAVAPFVTSVFVDDSGTAWAGTFGGGLVCVDGDEVKVFHESAGFDGRFIGSVRQTADGTLWVGTDKGLYTFENERFVPTEHSELAGAFVSALFTESDGTVWVATRDERLFVIGSGSITDRSVLLSRGTGYVKVITRDQNGTLWLGRSGGGLTRVANGRFDTFTRADGLPDDQILALYEDREGALWIGSSGGGLARLRMGKLVSYTVQEGLPHNGVKTVTQDASGRIWIGTEAGVALIQGGRILRDEAVDQALEQRETLSVYPASDGGLWIGTSDGLFKRRSDGRVERPAGFELRGEQVFVLFTDSRGVLWVGTDMGTHFIVRQTVRTLTTSDGMSSDYPSAIAEAPDGSIWVATYDGGLNRLVDGVVERTISKADGLGTDQILSLYVAEDGVIWVGTWDGGLNVIDGDRIVRFTRRNGLHNNTIMSLVPDEHGNVWMTSNRGVFSVAREEVRAVINGTRETIHSTVFDATDGLETVEANGGQQPAGWKSRDGRIWFPMAKGLSVIDPANIRTNSIPPPVSIRRIVIDGNSLAPENGGLSFKAGSDKLEFAFSALALSVPSRIQYRYRLHGQDEDWVDSGGRREAFYTNLDPGDYAFQVIASNEDGVWNETGASVAFNLAPRFYQTTWFLLLVIFSIFGVAFGTYHARMEQHRRRARELERIVDERTRDLRLEKEKTEMAKEVIEAQADKLRELDKFKTRFFANVSHEFRTPLTMIIGPLENALSGGYGAIDSAMKRQLEIMLRNAVRLMRLINQLLDLSKLEAGKMQLKAGARNIVKFLDSVLLTISPFADKKGLTLRFDTPEPEVLIFFEPDKLEKVFYNLLSNAGKFTPEGGEIAIEIERRDADEEYTEGSVEIRVRDTGRGIPAADIPTIFDRFSQVDGSNTRQHEGTGIGLSLVKEMVELHGGTAVVTSEVGKGTTFHIVFPIGCAHLKDDQILADHEGVASQGAAPTGDLMATDLAVDSESEEESETQLVSEPVADDAPLLLVVDDNPDLREYMGSIVGRLYRVEFAVDGVDGLEKVNELKPDLVLSDIMMPRMDGNEFCRRIKTSPDLQHIPVILVSARATQEVKMEGLEVGADDYVPKPFNAEELLARVKNLLTLRHHEKELKELNDHLEQKVQEQLATILDERTRYEDELISAKDKAEASSKLKSVILDNMNHEFRTPLAIIQGSVQVLAEEMPEEQQAFVTDIEAGTIRLQRTLEAVMELSRLEAEDGPLDAHEWDLVMEARRAVDSVRTRAEKKGLAIRVHDRGETIVETDPAAFRRIMDALLDNAVKFTDSGEVLVDVARRNDRVRVQVRDTGCGIREEFLADACEAFTQGSSGLDRSHEGFGIGLAIAVRIARRLGGSLTIESTLGEGTLVTVDLPAKVQEKAGKRKAGEARSA